MPGGGVDEMQNVPQCKKRQQSWGEDSVVGVESEGRGVLVSRTRFIDRRAMDESRKSSNDSAGRAVEGRPKLTLRYVGRI